MFLRSLSLTDFRNYETCDVNFPDDGFTLFFGKNGQGKSNLLEAISFLSLFRSFRNATTEVVVRHQSEFAILRGLGFRGTRELLVEMQLFPGPTRNKIQINKQPIRSSVLNRDHFVATIFSPDDLDIIKDGPSLRRDYIDEVISHLVVDYAQTRLELERILKQRNTLLKQSGGRLKDDIISTLDVWDEKFADVGMRITKMRLQTIDELKPFVSQAYKDLARLSSNIDLDMTLQTICESKDAIKSALFTARQNDAQRGVTTIGPHRDDISLTLNGLPARTHASQGEQRTVALALRLAAHRRLAQHLGDEPLLLLDDVFSELDELRSHALIENLPNTQTFITAASEVPRDIIPKFCYFVENGVVKRR